MKVIPSFILLLFACSVMAETKCIAHRGAHLDFTENSLNAIMAAEKIGVDGVELDVRHTKDGVPILVNDKILKKVATDKGDRVCSSKKLISYMSYFDIQENCQLRDGSSILSLDHALTELKTTNLLVFIDLKDMPNMNTATRIYESFKNSPERLRIISFRTNFLKKIKKIVPAQSSFWRRVRVLDLSILPKKKVPGVGINVWKVAFSLFTKHYNRFRSEVGVWTIKKERQMERLFGLGVNFITTDFPERCVAVKRMFEEKTKN